MDPLINTLLREFSKVELIDIAYDLSKYHRIQGSSGLEKAGSYILNRLKSISYGKIEYFQFPYNRSYGAYGPVAGWDVIDAQLEIYGLDSKIIHRLREAYTLVAAHTPSNDIDGEIIYVGNGEELYNLRRDVSDKIILAYGYPYIVYKEAAKRDVMGILIYSRNSLPNALPYRGLFLTPDELANYRIPMLTITRKLAYRIIKFLKQNKKVHGRIYVKTASRSKAYAPVPSIKFGEAEKEIHLFSHYCHPKSMINDNISGTSSLLELAIAFGNAFKSGELNLPEKISLRFIWFPEYIGSLAYLSHKANEVIFGVNLDMIGEKQERTGSTLNLVISPPSLYHPYEGIVYYELRRNLTHEKGEPITHKILKYRFNKVQYEMGSDHDVYLYYGIPSVMVNQWPDKYYHTNLDTIDKLDAEIATKIVLSIGVGMYKASVSRYNAEVRKMMLAYFYNRLGDEIGNTNTELLNNRIRYLHQKIGTPTYELTKDNDLYKLIGNSDINENSIEIDGEKYKYVGPDGPISNRLIYNRTDIETFLKIRNILKKNKILQTIVYSLIPIYMTRGVLSKKGFKRVIEMEYGYSLELSDIETIFNILLKAKLLEKL